MNDSTLKWKREIDELFNSKEVGISIEVYGVNNLEGEPLKAHSKTVKWYAQSFTNTDLKVIDAVIIAVQNQYILLSDLIREHYGDLVHDACVASVYTVSNNQTPNLISVHDGPIYGKWAIRRAQAVVGKSAHSLRSFLETLSLKLTDVYEIGSLVVELTAYQIHAMLPILASSKLEMTGAFLSDLENISKGMCKYLSQVFLANQIKQ